MPLILVAGATGHFGEILVKYLLSQKDKVRVLIRKESVEKKVVQELKHDGAEIAIGDVTDHDSLMAALKGVDFVISTVMMADHENLLLKGAIEAKVKLYIPSIWTSRTTNLKKEQFILKDGKDTIIANTQKSGLNYIVIEHGPWLNNLSFVGFDYQHNSVELAGDHKISFIHTHDVAALTHKLIHDSTKYNHVYYLEGQRHSQKDLVAIFEKHGKKFATTTVTEKDIDDRLDSFWNPFNFVGLLTFGIRKYATFTDLLLFDGDNFKLYPEYNPRTAEQYVTDILAGKDKNVY
jgi:uncharacterized protein YbjT (DUF2867 family)